MHIWTVHPYHTLVSPLWHITVTVFYHFVKTTLSHTMSEFMDTTSKLTDIMNS